MRYDTAVRRLRTIAESCERPNRLMDAPILVAAYVFGDVLEAPAELPRVQVAFVIDCPPEEELAKLEVEIEASLTHLGRVVEGYWDRNGVPTTRASAGTPRTTFGARPTGIWT